MKALILAVTLFLFIGPMQHCTRMDQGSVIYWTISKDGGFLCAKANASVVDPKAKPLTYVWTAHPVGHDSDVKTFPTKDAAVDWIETNYCQVNSR